MTTGLSKIQQEQFYGEIVRIYDLAEGLLDAIEHQDVKNPEDQVRLAEPVVRQVEESVEVLAETYLNFVENGEAANDSQMRKVESAIRKIFVAISEFNDTVKELKAS